MGWILSGNADLYACATEDSMVSRGEVLPSTSLGCAQIDPCVFPEWRSERRALVTNTCLVLCLGIRHVPDAAHCRRRRGADLPAADAGAEAGAGEEAEGLRVLS